MFDEIKSRADAASAQLAGLQRENETADPSRRAALESQLAQAREADAAARRELADAGAKRETTMPAGAGTEAGFSSAAPGAEVAAKEPEQPREINTVTLREGYSGPRLNYLAHKQTYVETHTHPDVVEARNIKATTAARDAAKEEQQAEQAKAESKAELKDGKDRDRAARIFEGGHDRGLGTADYLKIEADHRAETANFARNAEAAGQVKPEAQASDAGTAQHVEQPQAPELEAEPAQLEVIDKAEAVAAVEQTAETGVEHVVMKPGQELEGEIVAEVRVKDVVCHSVEFSDDNGQTKRTLVNAGGNDWSVGDAVQVARTSKGFEIEPSRDYGM